MKKNLLILALFLASPAQAASVNALTGTPTATQSYSSVLDAFTAAPTCANDGAHALTFPSGTVLCTAISGGGGGVTTTGTPASGNMTKFSGSGTITNGDLSGDVATSGTLVTTVSKVNGIAYSATAAVDTVPVTTTANTTSTYTAVPNCQDTSGNHLNYNTTTHALSCGTSSSGGGGGGSPSTSIKTANYTITTSDCWTTVMAGTGSTGQFTVTLPAVTGFSSGCLVYLKNGDTARGKILSGFPSGLMGTILWPLQTVGVQIINGAWQVVLNPGRWKVPSQQTIHVDVTNGSNSNDGLASGSGGAVQTAQAAWLYATYQFDNDSHTPIIAMACSQTHTTALSMGGTPVGTNLVQLSPDGNCSFTWSNSGSAITVGDLAELDLNLTYYGSSGSMTCNANTSNAASSGCIYLHNDVVLDVEGKPLWTPGGTNDNFIFADGKATYTIANGIDEIGSGTGNYYIFANEGAKGTWSGQSNAPNAASANGLFFLTGGSFLNFGGPAGSGWYSLSPSKIYGNSTFINNGVSIPGGTSVGTTGVNCSSLTSSC